MDHHRIWVRNNHIGIAALTRMIVVRSNVINARNDKLGYGDSAIFDPWGVPLVEAPLFKEMLITAEIPAATIDACKKWNYLGRLPQEMRDGLNKIWSKDR
jgi:predicted amidohydrolase